MAATRTAAMVAISDDTRKAKNWSTLFFYGTSPKFMDAITKMLEKQSFEKQDYLFKEGVDGWRGWNLDPRNDSQISRS